MPHPYPFLLALDPAILKPQPINLSALALLLVLVLAFITAYKVFRPNPGSMKAYVYQLLTSYDPLEKRRVADHKKFFGHVGMALVMYLVVQKRITSFDSAQGQALSAAAEATQKLVDSLLLFVAAAASIATWGQMGNAKVAEASNNADTARSAADAAASLAQAAATPQEVTLKNGPANPVAVKEVQKEGEEADPGADPSATQ